MKKTSKANAKRQAAQKLRQVKSFGPNVLLHHYRSIQVAVVVLGAMASLVVIVIILFTKASNIQEQVSEVNLNTDALDELELYIEDRQTAYENPPVVSADVFNELE